MAIDPQIEPRWAADRAARRAMGHAVAALAERQHGIVGRRQVLEVGFTRHQVANRIAQGHLLPVHRGVYAVGHLALAPRGRWMAATLAAGDAAVLSHRSAAALWGIGAIGSRAIDVTTPRRRGPLTGLQIHESPAALSCATTVDGIPVTSPARTLVDLASVTSPHGLRRAMHEAERLRLTGPLGVDALLARHPGTRGAAALRRLTRELERGYEVTHNDFEAMFLELVDAHGLPRPIANAKIEGFLVDVAWPGEGLIVELDGRQDHLTRRAFERDRLRDRRLMLAGWRVVRVTWHQLCDTPAIVAREIGQLLGRPAGSADRSG